MIQRGDVTREAFPFIDWQATGNASKLQTSGDKLWVAQFVSGFTATAVQMTYRHQRKNRKLTKILLMIFADGVAIYAPFVNWSGKHNIMLCVVHLKG